MHNYLPLNRADESDNFQIYPSYEFVVIICYVATVALDQYNIYQFVTSPAIGFGCYM